MALLSILRYPNPRLHIKAAPVTDVDESIRQLVKDMAETMYEAPGIGLAATQVDCHKRVIVIDISDEKNDLLILINPEITDRSGEQLGEEGCLSVPGVYEKVKRHEWIKVKALNQHGKSFEMEASGLLSVCIQHEIDHLEGRVFVEYLSRLKQSRIEAKFAKKARRAAFE